MTDIQVIKANPWPIYDRLLGAPAKTTKEEHLYHVPWRADKKPSLAIRKSDGKWFDNARDESGDVLDMVGRMHNLQDVSQQILRAQELQGMTPKNENPGGNRGDSNHSHTVNTETENQLPDQVFNKNPLFPIPKSAGAPPEHPTLGVPVMTWPYKNAQGDTEFYVCRFETADGKKIPMPLAYYEGEGWKYELKLTHYPLFGCELLAKHPNKEVLLVEGEKAAMEGRKMFPDMVTVCWHGGTGRIEQAIFAPLRNRVVTLWPDNDEPGKAAMAKALDKLKDVGADEVYFVTPRRQLEKGWDIADPAPEGINPYRMMDRRRRLTKTRFRPMCSTALAKKRYTPVEWVLDGVIPDGLTMLSAPGKIGKTFFCQELCLCIAEGKPFWDIPLKKGRAIYIDGEQNYRLVQKRLKDLGRPDGVDGMEVFCEPGFQLDAHGLDEIQDYLDRHDDVRLIVVDTLQRLIPAPEKRGGMDAYQAAVTQMAPVQEFVQLNDVPMIIVHHTKKQATGEGGEAYDDASGSRGYTGTAETLLTFKRSNGDKFKLSVVSRHGKTQELATERDGVHWKLLGDFETETASAERKAIMDVLRSESEPMSIKEVADAVGKVKDTVKKSLQRMAKAGMVVKVDGGYRPANTGISYDN